MRNPIGSAVQVQVLVLCTVSTDPGTCRINTFTNCRLRSNIGAEGMKGEGLHPMLVHAFYRQSSFLNVL